MITPERAIEILKVQSSYVASINIDAIIAYKTAIEATEKQVSKKPLTTIRPPHANKDLGICPICKHSIWQYTNYCDECGQKIDWEANKDV